MDRNKGHNMLAVKSENRSSIMNLLHKKKMLSRKDLSILMGLTAASLTINVNEMIEENILYEVMEDNESKRVGRKKKFVDLNYNYKKIIGLSIDNEAVLLYIGKMNLEIIESVKIECDFTKTSILLDQIALAITSLLNKYELTNKDIMGVGVSLVGIVDSSLGISISSWSIMEENIDFKTELEKRLGINCFVENNVRALAQAHKFLNYPEIYKNSIFVKCGNGIGTAITIDNKFYYGSDLKAGELGHVYVLDNMIKCRCSKVGCLETVASIWRLNDIIGHYNSYETILNKYNNNDEVIVTYLDNAIYYFALSLSNYITLFNPQQVILYGYLFENKHLLSKLCHNINQILSIDNVESLITLCQYSTDLKGSSTISIVMNAYIKSGGKINEVFNYQ